MTNLTLYQQNEASSIVSEALEVTPIKYHPQVKDAISYLAFCAVTMPGTYQNQIADIQALINTAKADNAVALSNMTAQLHAEMQQLRGEMRLGFEKVADCLALLHDRQSDIEQRLSQLEQWREPEVVYVREQPLVNQNYYIDNSYTDNSQHSNSVSHSKTGVDIEALAWTIVAIFFTVLICVLLPSGGIKR